MSTRARVSSLLAAMGVLSFSGAVLAGDVEKKPTEEKQKQPARVVVRDLRAADPYPYGLYGGYYYSRSPDEARRLIEETYWAHRRVRELERQRKFNEKDMAERSARLLSKQEQALEAGLRRLKAGQPERAVVALTLAAKLNQGDPASRIHLAQTRLALGHYHEAGLALRRALELQPKLEYIDLHLDQYYQQPEDLNKHTDKLRDWVKENPDAGAEIHFLLGFLDFQRGEFAAAHTEFLNVQKALPDDELTRDLLDITKPPANVTGGVKVSSDSH